MNIAEILEKMIKFSAGDRHGVAHFVKVWGYAKAIGELEKLDKETQFILEVAAITHDIACNFCREKYGSAAGKLQEKEGDPMVRDFLKDTGLDEGQVDRVAFLVGHHHTVTDVDGMDWQILLEADYLVNADEGKASDENIRNVKKTMFRTASGIAMLDSIYGVRS